MSRSTTDLDGKVRDIVNSYRSIEIVHPTLSNMFQSPEFKQAFLNSLTQDLHVIRQRSPNLIDGEISIVQKAFTILMEHEEDAVPAVELYVEEILGLRFVSEEDRFQTISIVVGTRDSLNSTLSARIEDQLFSPAFETHNEALSGSQSAHHERIPKDEALFVSNSNKAQRSAELSHIAVKSQKKLAESDTSGDPILKLSESDEMLKRLLDIYRKAKNDFHATPPKSIERTKSAKFLRDTVENCLSYLAAKEIPAYSMMTTSSTGKATSKAELLHQLQETLEETIAIAEKGSGGKKRRFEENVEGVPQEPARMKGTLVESPDPVFKGLPSERKPAIRSAAREKRSRAPAKVIGHEDQQRIDMAGRRRSSPQFQPYLSSTPQSTRHSSGDPSKSHRERSPFRGPRYCDSYRPSYE